ncbi:MAG TPA: YggT family protein [Burkholderiales bacterium]|nr:YggT family protein [Burkholderiales bacterium]
MVAQALIFLIETVLDFLTIAFLLRFLLQWARAAQRNQITDFLNALTNWAVRPARRIVPGWGGLDLATLFLAWLVQFAEVFLVLSIRGYDVSLVGGQAILGMALLAVIALVRMSLYILIVALIIQAVLSWVNPYSPIAPMINALTRPFVRPFQRLIPPVANVDLSPLFVIIVCQLLLMLPVAYLSSAASKLLAP